MGLECQTVSTSWLCTLLLIVEVNICTFSSSSSSTAFLWRANFSCGRTEWTSQIDWSSEQTFHLLLSDLQISPAPAGPVCLSCSLDSATERSTITHMTTAMDTEWKSSFQTETSTTLTHNMTILKEWRPKFLNLICKFSFWYTNHNKEDS